VRSAYSSRHQYAEKTVVIPFSPLFTRHYYLQNSVVCSATSLKIETCLPVNAHDRSSLLLLTVYTINYCCVSFTGLLSMFPEVFIIRNEFIILIVSYYFSIFFFSFVLWESAGDLSLQLMINCGSLPDFFVDYRYNTFSSVFFYLPIKVIPNYMLFIHLLHSL